MRRSFAEPNSFRARPAIMEEQSFSVPHLRPRMHREGGAFRASHGGQRKKPRRTAREEADREIGGGQSLVNRPKTAVFRIKTGDTHAVVRLARQSCHCQHEAIARVSRRRWRGATPDPRT